MSNNTAQIDVERKEESADIKVLFSILQYRLIFGERDVCDGYITYINLYKKKVVALNKELND